MPTLTEIQIREKIVSGEINGISLDTSIFDRYGCNLEFPLLKKLDQFKSKPTQVVFSEIIASEIKNHISRDTAEASAKLKTALNKQSKKWRFPFDITEIINSTTNSLDPIDHAQQQFDQYLDHVAGNIIPIANDVDIATKVFDRYFSSTTPFERKDAKKNEFPDAFALLSLEAEFSSNEKMVLCVSTDKGWADFAKNSPSLICVTELENALSYFNDIETDVVEKVIQMLKGGTALDLKQELEYAIQEQLEILNFVPTCDNDLDFDAEPSSSEFHQLNLDSISQPVIVDKNENDITLTFSIHADVGFEAEFNFHVFDSIDKDYVHLSTEYGYVDKELPFKIVVTIDWNVETEPTPKNIAVTKDFTYIDFGYVDPFPNEDPSHDKY